jgi:mannose-1-phosphate guanylyltransferase/phosphomannomutase
MKFREGLTVGLSPTGRFHVRPQSAEPRRPRSSRKYSPGQAGWWDDEIGADAARECAVDWSHDLFPTLLAERELVYGHESHGYWRDVGTIREYLQGQRDLLAAALHADGLGTEGPHHIWIGRHTCLAPGILVSQRVLVGPGCRIEPEARLLPGTVLGPGTTVRRGACIRGAVLGAHCVVGPAAVLRHCVVDDEVQIGARCVVGEGAVVSRVSRLGEAATVSDGSRIAPGQALPVAAVSRGRQPTDAAGAAV